jgi:dienelactone hydrolase
MLRAMRLSALLLVLCACACAPAAAPAPPAPDAPGPFAAGHRTFHLTTGARPLDVELWYPAAPGTAAAGEAIEGYVVREADRARYAALLSSAPEGCPTRTLAAARDAAPAEGPLPLLVFSHCLACTRFSSASLAEHLASHGFAVAAPDHAGNTLFDDLDGDVTPLDTTTLEQRAADVKSVLDALLDASRAEVPAPLRGRLDAARVGAFGHSFGSVTAGLVAQRDTRVRAAAGIAAPMENVLIPGVKVPELDVPLLFLLAVEDNSITSLGNETIRGNFAAARRGAWLTEVVDAGHWSFSDVAGLRPEFAPGCGAAKRQTNPAQAFEYLPVADAQRLARGRLAAFFRATLLGDGAARAWLDAPPPDPRATDDWMPRAE